MTSHITKKKPDNSTDENNQLNSFLILHNDDFHTFDFVINSLIEICGHDFEQAVQCTYLVHFKGRCDVKKGSYEKLKPLKDALVARELSATID